MSTRNHADDAKAPAAVKHEVHDLGHPNPYWILFSGLLVIGGGLSIAYCEKRTHEELAHQYERMHLLFENGNHELHARLSALEELVATNAKPDEVVHAARMAQNVLQALGKEAVVEHAVWLILRRARPLELHIGG